GVVVLARMDQQGGWDRRMVGQGSNQRSHLHIIGTRADDAHYRTRTVRKVTHHGFALSLRLSTGSTVCTKCLSVASTALNVLSSRASRSSIRVSKDRLPTFGSSCP